MRDRHSGGNTHGPERGDESSGRPGGSDLVGRRYDAVQRRAAGAASPNDAPASAPSSPVPAFDWAESLSLHLPPVQRDAEQTNGADNASVHAHAAHGLSGPSTGLPFATKIQQAFGPAHDVSGIHAHIGGEAADAAGAIGAKAYASGDGVAFAEAPDLHTAAHEAAHVVQQRAGVHLKGGVGSAGDAYEQHADAVANRVVAGRSAADLMPSVGGLGSTPHVQRQAADKAPESDTGIDPTADDIATAGLQGGDATFDVKWIESLPGRMLDQIDGAYAESKQSAAYKKALAADRRLREIEGAKKDAKQALAKDTAAELGVANNKRNRKTIEASDTYQTGVAAIDGEYADEVADRKDAIAKRVSEAGHKGKSWDDGRLTARMDFMSWGIALLGSANAVKSHFMGLAMIKGGAYLSAPAAARYNQAMAWFESTYPGSTFPRTSVGQALRGRHHGEHSKGLQGHPLGISLDFDAYVNVHQKDGVASFMLRKFGGGPNSLKLGDRSYDKVQEIGTVSAAGGPLAESQVAYLAAAEKAYDEMFATSERFKDALGPAEARLKEVQTLYYSVVAPGAKNVAAIEKDLAKAQRDASKRNGKKTDEASDPATDPRVVALTAQRDAALKSFETEKAKVQAVLEEVFAPWIETLHGEVAEIEAAHDRDDLNTSVDLKTADRCVKEVERAKKPKALRALITAKRYAPIFKGFDPGFPDEEFRTYHQAALTQAKEVRAAKYQSGEVSTRLELIRRFRDPSAVFGTGEHIVKEDTGEDYWRQKREVSQPPIIQYLETGFARNDEMGAPDARQDAEVFNGEFVAGMMRFGWYPGAAWGAADTMHFDFLDGFDAIVGTAKSFGPAE